MTLCTCYRQQYYVNVSEPCNFQQCHWIYQGLATPKKYTHNDIVIRQWTVLVEGIDKEKEVGQLYYTEEGNTSL